MPAYIAVGITIQDPKTYERYKLFASRRSRRAETDTMREL